MIARAKPDVPPSWNLEALTVKQASAVLSCSISLIYRAIQNAPDYELVQSDIKATELVYQLEDLRATSQMTLKVTAVRNNRESVKGTTVVWLKSP